MYVPKWTPSNQDLRDQNPNSINPLSDGCEYGAIIYTIAAENEIMYSYTEPMFRNGDGDVRTSVNVYDCIIPEGGSHYGIIHTHGADGYERLSRKDDISVYGRSENKVNYLVTPRGYIKKYNGNTQDVDSTLNKYRVYANLKDTLFKDDKEALLKYEIQYAHTKDILSTYGSLKNKLIWNLLLDKFSNINPLEIVEAVNNTNTKFEAVQTLQSNN